jgi:hypothetical protein
MKRIYSILAVLFLTINVFAQAPKKMSYQAVIRKSNNTLLASSPVGIKISILKDSATGTVVFAETYSPNPITNANGLVSLEIGTGTAITGTFAAINWATGPYFIKTETDPTGGTAYTIAGTNELMSVPYALFSANGTPGPQGPAGANGSNGTNGSNGAPGSIGATGPKGEIGTVGLTGPAGSSSPTMGLLTFTTMIGTTTSTSSKDFGNFAIGKNYIVQLLLHGLSPTGAAKLIKFAVSSPDSLVVLTSDYVVLNGYTSRSGFREQETSIVATIFVNGSNTTHEYFLSATIICNEEELTPGLLFTGSFSGIQVGSVS